MIALVILNYKTYIDSYELMKSIYNNELGDEITVFFVDNETNEYELSKLKSAVIDFGLDIHFLPQKDNLGFARGMNVGIDKARELKFEFVVCSNNDVLIPSTFSFSELVAPYQDDNNIAWIGPQITNLDSVTQNPLYLSDPFGSASRKKLIKSIFLLPFFGRSIFILRGLLKHYFSRTRVEFKVENEAVVDSIESGRVYSLHGSFFVLTPAYFSHYKNMDNNTFLYYEELILSKKLENRGLICYLNASIEVIHKEDSSTDACFGSGSLRKTIFVLKENYRSLVYYLNNYI
ncbi:Glyco_trans_2-like domain-containing protein [Vibrio chagasii]|nr:Glyco_trans_2-like domain-containing protein [Vibrio chagasii]CAH7100071.1 Glyco_trans_2-like domain-containing protein [Vibrio chagasii]CAH7413362.1 Glyco_trans_2-like domain-containing protein [Vibrio chagasii]CAH7474534.1 Glyco_trans_2-like domain-containing protein [Vibrio chagasii]